MINTLGPYRIPVYEGLAKSFDLHVLYGGREANRTTWERIGGSSLGLTRKRSWGFQLRLPRKARGERFDERFVHINPGYLFDLLRLRPDAVVTLEMGFRTLIALFYSLMTGAPVWIWWGGTPFTERGIGWLRKAIRRFISRRGARWISYGAAASEYLLSIGVKRDAIVQIQNCVDERLFRTAAQPALDLGPRPLLLHVGQLIGRKGIPQLLRAASRLQEEGTQFSLMLLGDGPEKKYLTQLAAELGLRNIHFLAAVHPDQMPSYYRSADVLVFPTLEDVWGLVVNEAMLCGTPVICSKYAGCATEILPNECIFDPLDDEDIYLKLKEAVQGKVPPADTSRLLTCSQVAALISDDIYAHFGLERAAAVTV